MKGEYICLQKSIFPPYCDGCPEIKPKAEVTQTVNMLDDDVNITCTKLKTCEKIKNYLAEQYRAGKIDT